MDGMAASPLSAKALDQAGFTNTPILSYAANQILASGFYGPFREAADFRGPQFGLWDRRSYQMDGSISAEAWRKISLDYQRGRRHDHGLEKPAMALFGSDQRKARPTLIDLPIIAAYRFPADITCWQGGPYAMGWWNRDRVIMESPRPDPPRRSAG